MTNESIERKSNWGVCTVCIPRESYWWLDDWIDHHVKAGASKVVVYDNTGSTGSTRRSSVFCTGKYQKLQKSKRGEKYGELTKDLSDFDIQKKLRDIASHYDGNPVEIVRWAPLNQRTGKIVHGQVEAYADFIRRYKCSLDWGAFLDMDEYLYCQPGLTVERVIRQLECEHPDVALVQLRGWRFECRWSQSGPKDIKTLLTHLPMTWGGEKNFARLKLVTHANIHWDWVIKEGCERLLADPCGFGFCHYNQKPEKLSGGLNRIAPREFLHVEEREDLKLNFKRGMKPQGGELTPPISID